MNKIDVLRLLFVGGTISLGLYFSFERSSAIDTCSHNAKAVVIKKYSIFKKGEYLKCEYVIGGKTHAASYSILEFPVSERRNLFVGDTVSIVYACQNPDLSVVTE